MNGSNRMKLLAAALIAVLGSAPLVHADTLTYHGSLQDGASAAEGNYDLRLTLYSAAIGGSVVAGPTDVYSVPVLHGNFSTTLDLDTIGLPAGGAWLDVQLRPAGEQSWLALGAREAVGTNAMTGACPGAWTLDGNAGNPPGSYLGTADASPVEIVANGTTRFYADPATNYATALSGSIAGTGIHSTAVSFANPANGYASFAGGFNGGATNDGSFVWGDYLGGTFIPITDSGPDQFIVQAGGGVAFNSNHIDSVDDLTISPRSGGDNDADLTLYSLGGNFGTLYISDATGILNVSATNGVHISNPVAIDGALKTRALRVEGDASKATAGGFKANSDRRIKEDIEPVADAINTVLALQPVTFRYTPEFLADHPGIVDRRYFNVVAQDFAAVFPDAVAGSGEYLPGRPKSPENEILEVDTYPALITTVAAVQELAAENAMLRERLDRLSARLDKVERVRGQ